MLAEVLTAATLLAGHSVQGTPLRAVRSGDPGAAVRVLVVGTVHGEEPGGRRVVAALQRARIPRGVQVWTLRDANPDGSRRRTRTNARGVDLNRNFAHRWRPGPRGRFFPGPEPFSEPETRALRRLVARVRPQLTVYFHEPYGFVVDTPTARPATLRAYARATGLPLRRLPRYRGTAVGWQHARDPGSESFVVELRPGRPDATRHARAILRLAATHPTRTARTKPRKSRLSSRSSAPERPEMRWTPIPFGTDRTRQMRAYARRHYGIDSHALQPRTIVQHWTGTRTFATAFGIFAANRRDPELRELPGVCAHFLVDRDGTIHQLARPSLMCRHTIGLNHVALGIEHVGTSDAQILSRRRQLTASLRLTRWLMSRHGIERRHVIGHAESLRSPFHFERIPRLRARTHGDFRRATMRRYRQALGQLSE